MDLNDDPKVRIRAFIGRSFQPEDEQLWGEIRKVLDSLRSLGFVYEDAKQPQPSSVSEKVRNRIDRNEIYVGVLSRRSAPGQAEAGRGLFARFGRKPRADTNWATSPWVLEESGFALGRNKRVLLLVEHGVDFPLSDINGDVEKIPFTRDTVADSCSLPLFSMIGHFIAEQLPELPIGTQTAPPTEQTTETLMTEVPPAGNLPADGDDEPTMATVEDLTNQGRWAEADKAFEVVLSNDQDAFFKEVLTSYYLGLKATKGHQGSLKELKRIAAEQPDNTHARYQLSHYYRGLKRYGEAAQVLLEGAAFLSPKEKGRMLRSAAARLAEDGLLERAIEILTDLRIGATEQLELKATYVALAEVAKLGRKKEIESAALEQVLAIEAGDFESRFRLAYLYSEMSIDRMALHHYEIYLAQRNKDSTAQNNLGVSFGSLSMPGKEIEMWETAGELNPLARANLSHAYADRGFLSSAERLATEVVKSNGGGPADEKAAERAARALVRIKDQRSLEGSLEEKILSEARPEERFRATYVEALLSPLSTEVTGPFQTRFGNLEFMRDGNLLVGAQETREEAPAGFASILGLGTPGATRVRIRKTVLEARLVGRAGTFQLKIEETGDSTLLKPLQSSVTEGLIIVASDGMSVEILEQHEKSVTIETARKAL